MSNPLSDFIDTAIDAVEEILNPSEPDEDEEDEDED